MSSSGPKTQRHHFRRRRFRSWTVATSGTEARVWSGQGGDSMGFENHGAAGAFSVGDGSIYWRWSREVRTVEISPEDVKMLSISCNFGPIPVSSAHEHAPPMLPCCKGTVKTERVFSEKNAQIVEFTTSPKNGWLISAHTWSKVGQLILDAYIYIVFNYIYIYTII